MKHNLNLNDALGISDESELEEILYKLVNVFKFKHMVTEELGTQLVKNLTYLLKALLTSQLLSLPKLFSRCSFIARKMMLNVNQAKQRITHVLLFFQVAFHLFSS